MSNAFLMTAKRNRYSNTQVVVCACYSTPLDNALPSVHVLQVLLVLEHLLCTYVFILR